MEQSIVKLKEELKKAYENIAYQTKTIEMERELYVNIRELLKSRDREINAMKEAYNMQTNLVKALENKIDNWEKTYRN